MRETLEHSHKRHSLSYLGALETICGSNWDCGEGSCARSWRYALQSIRMPRLFEQDILPEDLTHLRVDEFMPKASTNTMKSGVVKKHSPREGVDARKAPLQRPNLDLLFLKVRGHKFFEIVLVWSYFSLVHHSAFVQTNHCNSTDLTFCLKIRLLQEYNIDGAIPVALRAVICLFHGFKIRSVGHYDQKIQVRGLGHF